ncbi:hypothetical protein NT6N_07280 [Oceaniferula spumae]|uniref:Type II secretion system protein n=1 Tax=Oceaniferula spumae TaxID=2979115 RepID=A0AAT9FI82_9BACT
MKISATSTANRSEGVTGKRAGYVLLEIVIAMGLFAAVAVSLVKALHMTSKTASGIQDEMRIQRVLKSAMIDALSNPNLEERNDTVDLMDITGDGGEQLPFLRGDIETVIEPMEMENEDGQLLQNMFRIRVTFHWFADGDWQQQSAETWRYANLYKP